jgi:hypothetical protein
MTAFFPECGHLLVGRELRRAVAHLSLNALDFYHLLCVSR